MNHNKVLFAATDGIADAYLAEAVKPQLFFPSQVIKRAAAIAAVFVILIGLSILSSGNGNTASTPFFVTRVMASGNTQESNQADLPFTYAPHYPTPDILNSTPEACIYLKEYGIWAPYGPHKMHSYFNILLWFENQLPESAPSNIVVQYGEKSVQIEKEETFNDNIIIRHLSTYPDEYGGRGFLIMGWFDITTDIKITLYDNNGTVLQYQTIRISPTSPAPASPNGTYQTEILEEYKFQGE